MRSDALFRHLVHFFGTDLHFEGRSLFGNHGSVQRLIKIRSRHGDKVFDPARHRTPQIVNDAEHGIAVLHRLRDHPHGVEVVHLLDRNMLPLQLLVDAVQPLDAAFHRGGDARLFQLVAKYSFHPRQKSLSCFAAGFNRIVDLLISDRIDVAEAEVFQLSADFSHAQTVSDGGVDLESFAGNFLLPVRRQVFERPHVVQAVGQLDEHHADVIHHRQHHLAQVFGLLLFPGGEIDGADLGDALDDMRHLFAKLFADIDDRHRGIFHGVMQQPGGDRDGVHFHLGQDQCYFQGMDQIGLAGGTALSGVVFLGKFVGLAD